MYTSRLRHGFKDRDAKFKLCQFRPAHGKNPALMENYKRNRLTAVRQLHYSLHNENSIDLVMFVNGLGHVPEDVRLPQSNRSLQRPELEKLYIFGKNLMPRLLDGGVGPSILELDSDVRLKHYRLQKIGEQQLDLAGGGVVALRPATEAGTGTAPTDEEKKLTEIVEKMNDLFSCNLSEADMVGYVTTIKGKLLESEPLKEQAANNSEQQFAMGDFKDVLTDIVIEGQDAHNNIAAQLLKDERIFAAMQGMLAKMVWQQFQAKQQ